MIEPVRRNFQTEAMYVVSTLNGTIKSTHYSTSSAIQAAKVPRATRVVHGRHRGDWRPILGYVNGEKQDVG